MRTSSWPVGYSSTQTGFCRGASDPVSSPYHHPRSQVQTVTVTSVNLAKNTITVTPGLLYDELGQCSLAPNICFAGHPVEKCGIENS